MATTLINTPWFQVLLVGIATVLVFWVWQRRGSGVARRRHAGGHSNRILDGIDTVAGWVPQPTRLLTPRHRDALEVLRRALPDHFVLAQVPIARFVRVPTRLSYSEWMRRIGHVCVDLMVCDLSSGVIAVIDVRDPGRSETERTRKRRGRVERVMQAAGIPVYVWGDAMLPDPAAVRKALVKENPEIPPWNPAPPLTETFAQAEPNSNPITIPMGDEFEDPMAPPMSSWFDELHSTRPVQFDDRPRHVKPTGSGHSRRH
jgi:hypothetical protein